MHNSRIVLDLPFPPSVNHYYMRTKFGMTIGARGRDFRKEAIYLCNRQVSMTERFGADKRLFLSVAVFPPDRRKRDIDNIFKCLLDSLTHAGVYVDDSQIDHLECIRKTRQPDFGRAVVTIEEIEPVGETVDALKKSKKKASEPEIVT